MIGNREYNETYHVFEKVKEHVKEKKIVFYEKCT